MGDQTEKNQVTKSEPKPAIDFGAPFGNGPTFKFTEKPVASDQHVAQIAQVRDTPPEIRIIDRALQLSINDKDFDLKLSYAAKNRPQEFDKLKINDIPANVKVNYWQDPKGLFVWFENGPDNAKKHYLPGNLQNIELTNQTKTVESIRVDVNRNYAAATFSNLQNFDRSFNPAYDGGASSLKYFASMSQLGETALLKQEAVLREAAKTSDNPYYKIYLADVLTAAAVKPIINDFLNGGAADLNNPTTLRKLDEAISVLDAAYRDSDGKLKAVNHYPRANIYSPAMPGGAYWNAGRYPNDYFGFWAGSYDQAMARQASLKIIRDHIKQNSFPKFELPPSLPPRRF
mgnify:CR=1 FL=1